MDLLPEGWYAKMNGAILLSTTFVFARPKNHFRANGELKPNAPKHCTGRIGDVSKLVRAVEDAMTGIVYNDDAQIISLIAHRRFANDREQPCAIITVTALS